MHIIYSFNEMQSALDYILDQARAKTGSLMLMDSGRGKLRIVAARGFPETIIEQIKKFELNPGQGIAGHVYQTGEPYYLKNAAADPQYVQHAWSIESRFQFLSLPLAGGNKKTVGVLNIHFPTDRLLNAKELELLRLAASELVINELATRQELPC